MLIWVILSECGMIFFMEDRKKTLVLAGLAVGGLLLTAYLAIAVVPKALVLFSKAAPASKVSIANSYVLGAKILAKADGKDECKINVFVLDASGKGVSGKKVELSGAKDIKTEGTTTDNDGKMAFTLTSLTEGQFELTASVAGVPLPKTIKVTFRN